jgi:hypothetical protein
MTKEIKLTPELRKKLMGFSIAKDTIEMPLEIDGVPEEFTPVFILKQFSYKKREQIKKDADDGNELSFDETIRQQVVGWRNLYDLGTGELLDFVADESGGCSKDYFCKMPHPVKLAIANFLGDLQLGDGGVERLAEKATEELTHEQEA